MLLDRVDESDHVIGTVMRRDVFHSKAGFRVAHIFVFPSPDVLLLQRLASTRDRHGGLLGSSVAGYVHAGESYHEAAVRRLREELGVSDVTLRPYVRTVMYDQGCAKHIELFTADYSGPLQPDREHIDAMMPMTLGDVLHQSEVEPATFTPTFLYLLRYLRSPK